MVSRNSHDPINPAGLTFLTDLGDLEISNVIAVWVTKLAARRQLFFPTFKENLKQEN